MVSLVSVHRVIRATGGHVRAGIRSHMMGMLRRLRMLRLGMLRMLGRLRRQRRGMRRVHHLIVVVRVLIAELRELLFERNNVVDSFFQNHCL